MIEHNLFGK